MKLKCSFISLTFGAVMASQAHADVLYTQPSTGSGGTLQSSYWDPDGSDYDQMVWDGFLLPNAANITEIQWRGAYPGGGTAGGNISDFEVAIYASIPAGTQPDLGFLYPGPLVHYFVGGNAGETFAGNVGGTNMYDYHCVLPQPFLAAGNVRYWVYIVAWQPGIPNWGLATGTGGNGSHFHRMAYVGDAYYYIGSSDAAFTLIGTTVSCSVPTITQDPAPVTVCYGGASASFSVAATGTGTLAYRWLLNGSPVYDGPNGGGHGGGATISGATTANLTIAQPSYWADVGTYSCLVSNNCGNTTSAGAALVVSFGPPTISSSPAAASACAGGTVTFSVTASSTTPLTYSWRKNWGPALVDGPTAGGSIISGAATATLTIVNVQPADVATYGCSVTNGCQANSTAAALGVFIALSGDVNGDGVVDGGDVQPFVNLLLSGGSVSQGFCAADMVPNGTVDVNDVPVFVNRLLGL